MMKAFTLFAPFFFLLAQATHALVPVPYSGKVAINGVNFSGQAQFIFSLFDGTGATHWRNGSSKKDTIGVKVINGRYSVLLGGQGMNPLPPELFLTHNKLFLKVEFDNGDGKGLRHLAPDQLITATPKALVAEVAKFANVAEVANGVRSGSVTKEMLNSELASELSGGGKSANSNNTTLDGGVVVAVSAGENFSSDATPVLSANPQSLTWTATPSLDHGQFALVTDDTGLYAVGGATKVESKKTLKKWDFSSSSWTNLATLPIARSAPVAELVDGKIYAIGGRADRGGRSSKNPQSMKSLDIYDISLDRWTETVQIPIEFYDDTRSISQDKMIYIERTQCQQSQ
jgi:hypothetical protein